jgi:hypothetical protein
MSVEPVNPPSTVVDVNTELSSSPAVTTAMARKNPVNPVNPVNPFETIWAERLRQLYSNAVPRTTISQDEVMRFNTANSNTTASFDLLIKQYIAPVAMVQLRSFILEKYKMRDSAQRLRDYVLLEFDKLYKKYYNARDSTKLDELNEKIRMMITKLSTTISTYMKLVELFSKSIKNINKLIDHIFVITMKVNPETIGNYIEYEENLLDSQLKAKFKTLHDAVELHNTKFDEFLKLFLDHDVTISDYNALFNGFNHLLNNMERNILTILNSTTGGIQRRRSKPCTFKYYLKAFKSYSKKKLKTFRKRRNYKKTKRRKY